ncbi:MAG: transcriptional regulator [Ignavibacteriales bacterium]
MEFFRIQDKMISREKILAGINKILELRSRGFSQQEVADRLAVDRTFISRLETLGEVRKGQTIAVVGFPILNKQEIEELLQQEGVDFVMLMTEQERNDFVVQKTGSEMLNELMDLINDVRGYDVVVLLASDYRLKLCSGLLDSEIITMEIGESPLKEDKWVNPQELQRILRAVKGARNGSRLSDRRKMK